MTSFIYLFVCLFLNGYFSYLWLVISSAWSSEMLCLTQSQMPRMVLLEMQSYYCVKPSLHFVHSEFGLGCHLDFSASVSVRSWAAQAGCSGRSSRSIPQKATGHMAIRVIITCVFSDGQTGPFWGIFHSTRSNYLSVAVCLLGLLVLFEGLVPYQESFRCLSNRAVMNSLY